MLPGLRRRGNCRAGVWGRLVDLHATGVPAVGRLGSAALGEGRGPRLQRLLRPLPVVNPLHPTHVITVN